MLAAALTLMGCSRESSEAPEKVSPGKVSMRRVALPGFSVEAPLGEIVEHSPSPTSGRYEIQLPKASLADHFLQDVATDSSFVAAWSNQTDSRETWEQENVPVYITALQTEIPEAKVLYRESLDEHRWFSIVGRERVPLGLGVVVCDPKFQVEITFSRYHVLEPQIELMRETLKSVRCEVSEENRTAMSPSPQLPEDFGTVPTEDGFQFQSLGGEIVVANFTGGRMPAESEYYEPALHAVLSMLDVKVTRSALAKVAPTRSLRNVSERMTRARLPSNDLIVYIGSLYCEKQGVTLMFIWLPSKRADALSWERFGQVGCPAGEPVSLPTYVSLVESACGRGDAAACEIRKGL